MNYFNAKVLKKLKINFFWWYLYGKLFSARKITQRNNQRIKVKRNKMLHCSNYQQMDNERNLKVHLIQLPPQFREGKFNTELKQHKIFIESLFYVLLSALIFVWFECIMSLLESESRRPDGREFNWNNYHHCVLLLVASRVRWLSWHCSSPDTTSNYQTIIRVMIFSICSGHKFN